MKKEIDDALIDVRKAYRLIYIYQKRLLDIVQKIADKFDESIFYSWSPTYNYRPTQRTNFPANSSMWRMLPMISVSFLFKSERADNVNHKPGDWLLEIYIVSDSEYDNWEEPGEADPTKFKAPQETESKLTLFFIYCEKKMEFDWFKGFWDATEYPEAGETTLKDYDGLKIISEKYNLADMGDEQSIMRIVEDFKQMVHKKLQLKEFF